MNPSPVGASLPQLPETALLIDPDGLWDVPLDALPSFGGRFQWKLSTVPWPPEIDGFSVRLANSTPEFDVGVGQRKGCVTVLVDSVIPIGLKDCGAILVCSRDAMVTAVASMAAAILSVSLANYVVEYGWKDALEVISRDVLLVAASMRDIDVDTIAACVTQTLGYFQGTSRIEPEAVMLGTIASERAPPHLRFFSNHTKSIRALSGWNCYSIVSCHLSMDLPPAAYLLATFPIPVLPGHRVLPRRRLPR
jgi:hypothetical protein